MVLLSLTLLYLACSTQQGVGTPLGANERLIGHISQLQRSVVCLLVMSRLMFVLFVADFEWSSGLQKDRPAV
jgi:hypothetical protein